MKEQIDLSADGRIMAASILDLLGGIPPRAVESISVTAEIDTDQIDTHPHPSVRSDLPTPEGDRKTVGEFQTAQDLIDKFEDDWLDDDDDGVRELVVDGPRRSGSDPEVRAAAAATGMSELAADGAAQIGMAGPEIDLTHLPPEDDDGDDADDDDDGLSVPDPEDAPKAGERGSIEGHNSKKDYRGRNLPKPDVDSPVMLSRRNTNKHVALYALYLADRADAGWIDSRKAARIKGCPMDHLDLSRAFSRLFLDHALVCRAPPSHNGDHHAYYKIDIPGKKLMRRWGEPDRWEESPRI